METSSIDLVVDPRVFKGYHKSVYPVGIQNRLGVIEADLVDSWVDSYHLGVRHGDDKIIRRARIYGGDEGVVRG